MGWHSLCGGKCLALQHGRKRKERVKPSRMHGFSKPTVLTARLATPGGVNNNILECSPGERETRFSISLVLNHRHAAV